MLGKLGENMKIRTGFVSNSSSASFIIDREFITQDMLNKICDHEDVAEKYDAWDVRVDEKEIVCSTTMDNFDLVEYARTIGVPDKAIKNVDGENYEIY